VISNKTSLKEFNTFGIDAGCTELIPITSEKKLLKILPKLKGEVKVLGGGSNILLTQDQDGVILHNRITGIKIMKESEDEVLLEVGGGHNWHEFVLWAVERGYGGVENLSLIPGTVGAAPIQNIGAYGVEQKDVFVSLTAVHLKTGKEMIMLEEDCEFGYRDSVFKRKYKGQYIITSVRYKLAKQPVLRLEYGAIKMSLTEHRITRPTIKDISDIIIEIRNSKLPDPKIIGNSGSFFKNPLVTKEKFEGIQAIYPTVPSYPVEEDIVKIPAGWLIEQCGWKGKRVGNTGTYKHQALVLVNHGNAQGAEVWELAKEIIVDVENKFGIVLIPEVNIW
jgi:UDP-N-acetylmuramate dehydrogenase